MARDPRDTPCETHDPFGGISGSNDFHDFRRPVSHKPAFWRLRRRLGLKWQAPEPDPCELFCVFCGLRWYS